MSSKFLLPVALKSPLNECFNNKGHSKSKPNLLEEEDDWETMPPLAPSTPNIFDEPMATDGWEEEDVGVEAEEESTIVEDVVLEQLEIGSSGHSWDNSYDDWKDGNFDGEHLDRIFAQAKRAGGRRRRILPLSVSSEESLLDMEMQSMGSVCSQSLSMANLFDCDYKGGLKKNATKRDACGNIVFHEDDWGFIKGLDYKARESEDVRKSKCVCK